MTTPEDLMATPTRPTTPHRAATRATARLTTPHRATTRPTTPHQPRRAS
ncbi:hypothetical protein [Kitasatospora sp. NPDC056181]